jgi:hypothetical protein
VTPIGNPDKEWQPVARPGALTASCQSGVDRAARGWVCLKRAYVVLAGDPSGPRAVSVEVNARDTR